MADKATKDARFFWSLAVGFYIAAIVLMIYGVPVFVGIIFYLIGVFCSSVENDIRWAIQNRK